MTLIPEFEETYPEVMTALVRADRQEQCARIRQTYETMYHARQHNRPLGPKMLTERLTQTLGGYLRSGIYLLLGKPGTGKSAFCMQMAINTPDVPVLYITAEMDEATVYHRIAANVTGEFIDKFDGKLQMDRYDQLVTATNAKTDHITIKECIGAFVPVEDIEEWASDIKGDAAHVVIIIDSFNSWASGAPAEYGQEERGIYERLLNELSAVASRLSATFLLIVERNRATMGGGMHAAAGTRRFEFLSNAVLDLDTVTYGDEAEEALPVSQNAAKAHDSNDYEGRRPVRLTIRKNRFGASNVYIDFEFVGVLQRFEETSHGMRVATATMPSVRDAWKDSRPASPPGKKQSPRRLK